MKTEKACGILELGHLEDTNEPGVKLRTRDGVEFVIPLEIEEVQSLGKEGLLFKNLRLTITIEADGT